MPKYCRSEWWYFRGVDETMSWTYNCFFLLCSCQKKIFICPFGKETSLWKTCYNRAMRYGRLHEVHTWNEYTKYLLDKHKDATVTKTGLHIDQTHNWIGASPDGIVNDPSSVSDPHGLLVVKCPESTSFEELCGKSNFFLGMMMGIFI